MSSSPARDLLPDSRMRQTRTCSRTAFPPISGGRTRRRLPGRSRTLSDVPSIITDQHMHAIQEIGACGFVSRERG